MIELVVVIVLAAILAAVAVPSLATVHSTRAAAAARQLARDLAFARQQAVSRGRTVWMVFNTSTDTYSILVEPTATSGRAGAIALTDPATGRAFNQRWTDGEFQGVDLVSASIGGVAGTDLGFDWLGRPLNASAVQLTSVSTITLTGSRTVTVQPQTGYVKATP